MRGLGREKSCEYLRCPYRKPTQVDRKRILRPTVLKGDEIPIWAQVVALADCYDALVRERIYKPAYSHEKALEMI